jgi:Flp pilus assembly pilin Flp
MEQIWRHQRSKSSTTRTLNIELGTCISGKTAGGTYPTEGYAYRSRVEIVLEDEPWSQLASKVRLGIGCSQSLRHFRQAGEQSWASYCYSWLQFFFLRSSGNYARSTVSSKGVFPAAGESQEEDKPMKPILLKLLVDEEGQDIAEYAVMLAVILVIVVGTIRLVGSNANNAFSNVASSLQ